MDHENSNSLVIEEETVLNLKDQVQVQPQKINQVKNSKNLSNKKRKGYNTNGIEDSDIISVPTSSSSSSQFVVAESQFIIDTPSNMSTSNEISNKSPLYKNFRNRVEYQNQLKILHQHKHWDENKDQLVNKAKESPNLTLDNNLSPIDKAIQLNKIKEDNTIIGPEAGDVPHLDHMDELISGMMKLLQTYSQADETTSSETNSNNSPDVSNIFPYNKNTNQGLTPMNRSKIKHDLVMTMRKSVPLNYLKNVSKKNNLYGIRLFPCPEAQCHNLYQTKGSLRRHIYSHTGERPYVCQYPNCEKAYSASDRLAEHMHSHTNERPYICSFPNCKKAYNDPKTLREHKLTHGVKTFVCDVEGCEKRFHRKTHLKQHQRIHSKVLVAGVLLGDKVESKTGNSSKNYQSKSEDLVSDVNQVMSSGSNNNNVETIKRINVISEITQPFEFNEQFRSLLNNSDNSHFRINKKDSSD